MISYILSITALIQMWLLGNKWRYAPLLGAFLQIGWFYFAIAEEQYGFIIGSIGFFTVNMRNHFIWNKKNEIQ